MNGLSLKIDEINSMINKEMVQIMSLKLSFFECIFNDNNLQLGMMVIAVGLSSYNVALFHLINHALTAECM